MKLAPPPPKETKSIPDPRSPEELAMAILIAPQRKLSLKRKSTVKRDKQPKPSHQSR